MTITADHKNLGQNEIERRKFQKNKDHQYDEQQEMHAVEDFENLGHVINVQIGSADSQDLFFR